MNATAERPFFVTPVTIAAVLATSIAGIVQTAFGERPQLPIVLVTGGVTMLIGTLGIYWAERQPGIQRLALTLVAYAAAVCLTLWVSHGACMLLSMPLVSVGVLFFSLRIGFLLGAVSTGLFSAAVVRFAPAGATVLPQALAGALAAYGFVLVFSTLARRERYARRDLERMSAELEALATTRERNRIAREIHDSLGHYLTVASMQLEASRSDPEHRDERVAKVAQLLRDGLGELRRSVSMLRDETSTGQPFTAAIAELVKDCSAAGLPAELRTQGDPRPLSGTVGFTLYRAAQEALTNARKHAAAKQVTVALDYSDRAVKLTVADDGSGAATQLQPGNGLKGLRERVELVGGTVAFEPSPGGGVTVRVEVSA
ncbi:MAG: sensor histidine kinase [Myxococcaceae bacterium]